MKPPYYCGHRKDTEVFMELKDITERNAMNYYISDLHIGHENILRFDNRPFADVSEMNNKLIERSAVQP